MGDLQQFGPSNVDWGPSSQLLLQRVWDAAAQGQGCDLSSQEVDRLGGILWTLGVEAQEVHDPYTMVRMSIPGNACNQCNAIIGQQLACPGCGWVDPMTHNPKPKKDV
jgi:hypothetical protein